MHIIYLCVNVRDIKKYAENTEFFVEVIKIERHVKSRIRADKSQNILVSLPKKAASESRPRIYES